MISKAREHAAQCGLHIDFQQQDAENLPFKESTFHVVVARNLLWTLPDPERALREWRRVLKPDGDALISVWSKWQDRWRWQSFRQLLTPWMTAGNVMVPWKKDDMQVQRFYHLYGRREFQRDIQQAGLHVSRIWSVKKASKRHQDNHFVVVTKTRGKPAKE
jgi:ubiquinone/menaquinone biosynthesis C-methylase UbiE